MKTSQQTAKIPRRKLPDSVRKPVTELTLALRALLGPQLEQVILFGSYARGEAQPPDSDLDVLLVLRDGFDFWATDRLVSRAHFSTSQMPFVANVRNEGIAV